MTLFLSVEQIIEIHRLLVADFGGAHGLRDRGGLEAAVARPQTTFGGEDLYPGLPDKAAALAHSLVLNHPFLDGNKRVGAMAAELFLLINGAELRATDQELIAVTLQTSEGKLTAEALTIWFRQRTREDDGW